MGAERQRALTRFCLLVAVPLVLPPIAAGDDGLRPRVIVSWEERDTGGASTSRLRQDIDLFLAREVTESVTLRLNLGVNRYDLGSERGGVTGPATRALELRPSGMLTAQAGPVLSESEYRLRRSRYETGGTSTRRDDEQMRSSLSWAPSRLLPGGAFSATRSRLGDGGGATRVENQTVDGSLTWAIGGLTASAGQGIRLDRDSRAGYERTLTDQRASLSFADSWLGGRLSIATGVNGSLSRIDDTARASARIPTWVQPARALWGVDDTPLDSSDQPLSPYPALIDGRAGVSAEIDLGPAGAAFQAIAFDIGRVSPVDEIQIVVRDERLEPVTQPGGIDWDVFTSTDGVRWTPHGAGLISTFDTTRSQYEIAFQQVDVRWIKVVTFGSTAAPVLVTEALLLFHTESAAADNDSEFRMLASNASVVFAPGRGVTLGYTGAGYQTSQQSGRALDADVRDVLHNLSARFDASRRVGLELRWESHDSRTDRLTQDARALIASMRYAPRPQLSTHLTCEARGETIEEVPIDSRTCSAQLTARVFPTLEMSGGGSQRRQTLESGGSVTTRSLYLHTNARVFPAVRLTLSGTMNRSTVDAWDGPVAPPSSDDRVTADVDWTGGRAIGLGGTFGWAQSGRFSGLVQRYRVRWSPFGDGSVSLTTSFTRDIDPYSISRSERLLVSPRWQVNPRTALNIVYSTVRTGGEQPFQSDSVLASLIYGR